MAKKKSKSAAARRRQQARRVAPKKAQQVQEVDFSEEYTYVVADLKRFGLLAVAMFALLAVLALAL